MERLRLLAPRWPLTAAYGVPLLARDGVAAVVALGTDWLVVRVETMPAEINTEGLAPGWSFVTADWHVISPWQSDRTAADGARILQDLVTSALAYAARLASA
jgi:hypothetical protein